MADDDDQTIDAADEGPAAADGSDAGEADEGPDAADLPDEDEDADPAPPVARRGLDGRTLAICALVAVIAALLAGVVTSRLTADDGDEPLAGQGRLTPAEELPDIVLPRLGGGEDIRLSDLRGQPLIVNFWGSWCEPCVDEMPAFERVHESLGDQVTFLGVNVNDTVEAATTMVARTGVTYELARDEDGALGRALDISTFPTTVLILPDGTIAETVYRQMSAERLCEKVNQSLLNQSLQAGECG